MKDNKKLLKLPNISFPALNNQFSRKPLNIYFLNSIKNFKIKLGNAQTSLTTKNFKNGKNIKTQSIGILILDFFIISIHKFAKIYIKV